MAMNQEYTSASAGIGDPYWFEWGIGLLKAIEMLNPDSDIEAVAFQKDGVKGWDDVVIRFKSGRHDYYQVKHSRPRSNLTFSDLVSGTTEKPSLLSSLVSSWIAMGLCDEDSSCILTTNRSAGSRAGRSAAKLYYPPLSDFIEHLVAERKRVVCLEDISIPEEWQDAWGKWISEMGAISPQEKFIFLGQLSISVNAPQLDEMHDLLGAELATCLGITVPQAVPLVQGLLSAPFTWATSLRGSKEWVTAEDVMAVLSESTPDIFGYCDVPTPVPFFSSRERFVEQIVEALTGEGEQRIIFLEADPGAGKTSVVSRIVNQRAEDYSTLVVDVRYYAYRPITPDAPAIPVDADLSASPTSLWYSLLSQIRERLPGRLMELQVPVRNHFLTAEVARNHVLRLADILSQAKGAPFVIVIDGIDHAARACRKGLPSLLESLPIPETIPDGVRILIAGQPASAYSEYPIWLRAPHDLVKSMGLNAVDLEDVSQILLHSLTPIPSEYHHQAARVILDASGGNTLSTVFAVAEAGSCHSIEKLEERLRNRNLHSGIHSYYQSIWDAAIHQSPKGVGAYISAALSILRERITGTMLHKAFLEWGMAIPEWDAVLKTMEPLVVLDDSGYRVRHNDIRVFLEQELRADNVTLQHVASKLADYYINISTNCYFRQESLFTLLHLAQRDLETARFFNPSWVLDAIALGRDLSVVNDEAKKAFCAVPHLQEWEAALAVACGGMTLQRISDCLEYSENSLPAFVFARRPAPQCLETERFVPPFNLWGKFTVQEVLSDVRMLLDGGEDGRAKGLMEHWLDGVSPLDIVNKVPGWSDRLEPSGDLVLVSDAADPLEEWGALAFKLKVAIAAEEPANDLEDDVISHFEKGWVEACIECLDEEHIYEALTDFSPIFISTFETAAQKAVEKGMWVLVANLLNDLIADIDVLDAGFKIKAAYWALRCLKEEELVGWFGILPEARSGSCDGERVSVPLMLCVARIIGWTEAHRDISAIASELTDAALAKGHHVRKRQSLIMSFSAAAMVGLLEGMLSVGDQEGAAVLVPPQKVRLLIESIWCTGHSLDFHEFHRQLQNLASKLVVQCRAIGGAHSEMVLELCLATAKTFPVDQKLPIVWDVLRRDGHTTTLRSWAEHWIGENGITWDSVDSYERGEIVEKLCRLCREMGWDELASAAEDKLRYRLIGYLGHKDYSFQEPLDWLEELTRINPGSWEKEGVELLDICRVCDDQGGDNRLHSSIETEVAAAAFRCGPNDAWSFFNWINIETERYWLQTAREVLISASRRVIKDKSASDQEDILALWCCAIGISRWFDEHQVQKITALRDVILATVPDENRPKILNRMRQLTPGEIIREKYDNSRPKPEKLAYNEPQYAERNDIDLVVAELIEKVAKGYEPSFKEIGCVAIRVAQENPQSREKLMGDLFAIIDGNRAYLKDWDYWGQAHPLRELVPVLRENEVWELMQAAVRPVGEAYWERSVSHNVHLLCLFNAIKKGDGALQTGTQTIFNMHRLWAGMPENAPVSDWDVPDDSVKTWFHFAAYILRRLLSSDSAETVSGAIRGLNAVVEVSPDILGDLFEGCDDRQLLRLLLGLEVWSARHPKFVGPVLGRLWESVEQRDMRNRIQLWICTLFYSNSTGDSSLPESFLTDLQDGSDTPDLGNIIVKPKRLLKVGAKDDGCVKISNAFSAARHWLYRLEAITGCDTDNLEEAIAKALEEQSPDDKKPSPKNRFAVEDGDMVIVNQIDEVLDSALYHELKSPFWQPEDAMDVAIAVTHGDDPWVLRNSPLPSPSSFDWPEAKEVDEWLGSGKDNNNVLQRLQLLLKGGLEQAGQVVMGAYLRLFTNHHDCEMWYWLERVSGNDVVARGAPLGPSGRCFPFFAPDRYEPYLDGRVPLVYFSRSSITLSFSTVDVIPASGLQRYLGWRPVLTNPLEWQCEGRRVAKYETYHSPLRGNWSRRHMRQSTLSRWVVNPEELSVLPDLTPQWDHKVYPFENG